jgi:hypothetical protein
VRKVQDSPEHGLRGVLHGIWGADSGDSERVVVEQGDGRGAGRRGGHGDSREPEGGSSVGEHGICRAHPHPGSQVLSNLLQHDEAAASRTRRAFVSFGYSDEMAQNMIDMDIAKEHGLDNGLERTPENTTPITFRQGAEEVLKPALDAR